MLNVSDFKKNTDFSDELTHQEDLQDDLLVEEESSSTEATKIAASRRDFRSLVFHFLYAMESFDYSVSLESIILNFNSGFEIDVPVDGEVAVCVLSIIEHKDELNLALVPLLANWRIERLGVCTRLVLTIALWELLHTDTPAVVVINEAIELSKCFSEKDAYKFVNGILDEASKKMDKHKKYDYKDISSL